jgi:hypothetical protein
VLHLAEGAHHGPVLRKPVKRLSHRPAHAVQREVQVSTTLYQDRNTLQ